MLGSQAAGYCVHKVHKGSEGENQKQLVYTQLAMYLFVSSCLSGLHVALLASSNPAIINRFILSLLAHTGMN